MEDDITQIASIESAEDRARAAHDLVSRYQLATAELSRLRREALDELVGVGHSHNQLAKMLGVTRARVGQILSSGPRTERVFLGSGPLTVAVGGKREADKAVPGSVVAQEDLDAYHQMHELAKAVGLDIRYEVIQPPGMIDLNRDNLVVICGPRLSPLIAQVLAADPHLGFDHDEHGWYLRDRTANVVYRSPIDAGDSGDYAYLGRLPRLDGRGGFLYIAGIHAIGAAGVIHYLCGNLPEIYQQVKTRRFSAIIGCQFDPETHQITSSELVSPLYRPDSAP